MLRTGVVTNQSEIGHVLVTHAEAERVNAMVNELVGPFDLWRLCPHTAADRCPCRKPAAGMVTSAARALRLDAERVVVAGDIGSDLDAAHAWRSRRPPAFPRRPATTAGSRCARPRGWSGPGRTWCCIPARGCRRGAGRPRTSGGRRVPTTVVYLNVGLFGAATIGPSLGGLASAWHAWRWLFGLAAVLGVALAARTLDPATPSGTRTRAA